MIILINLMSACCLINLSSLKIIKCDFLMYKKFFIKQMKVYFTVFRCSKFSCYKVVVVSQLLINKISTIYFCLKIIL